MKALETRLDSDKIEVCLLLLYALIFSSCRLQWPVVMEKPTGTCTAAVEGSVVAEEYFGSPPEPVFNGGKNGLSVELLEDSLKLLASKNEAAVKTESKEDFSSGCFKKGQPVQFIFELCKHFGLNSEVQYKAAELFHRFMIGHIKELYQV